VHSLRRFARRYKGRLLHLYAEEYVGWLTRSLPGPEGLALRGLAYRMLFKSLKGSPLIYAGAYFTHTYGIEVGRHFSVNSGALIDGRGGIRIGDWVMIGPHAVITSSEHQNAPLGTPMASVDHSMKALEIEDDVWIGAHAFIRGGIRVGRGAIVAAGAVVVGDVPPGTIVGGVPAKVIGMRDDRAHADPAAGGEPPA
jgi:acetyltransferase-like isoleucine patch superfamily enzyme